MKSRIQYALGDAEPRAANALVVSLYIVCNPAIH